MAKAASVSWLDNEGRDVTLPTDATAWETIAAGVGRDLREVLDVRFTWYGPLWKVEAHGMAFEPGDAQPGLVNRTREVRDALLKAGKPVE